MTEVKDEMNQSLLEVRGLKTYFFTDFGVVKAIDPIDLKIGRNEVVGLVGESGCGKSTIALSIMRMIPVPGRIIEGEILFRGKDLMKISQEEMRRVRGAKMSMIFQDPLTFLNPSIKVSDQIAEAFMLHQQASFDDVNEKVIKLLEAVGIPGPKMIAGSYPFQLSGGMRQRVLIAIALACNPDLIIADEPTSALDVTVQIQILSLLKDLKKRLQSSVLLITHDLGIIAEMCDRVYVMYAGHIVEHGNVFQIFENPRHPYTIGLLKSILSIDEFRKVVVTIEGNVPDLVNPPPGCKFNPRCPHAKEICRERLPSLVEVEQGHEVSCWFCDGG